MSLLKGELQADNGDALYPHTSSDVVFGPDGKTVQEQIGNLSEQIENIDVSWTGVTGKPSTFPPSIHKHTKAEISDFPTSMPANGGNASTVNGKTVEANVPANAKFTDTIYTHPGSGTNPHGTSKADVGLGSVQNYGVATQAQVDAATANNLYVTPLGLKGLKDSVSSGKQAIATAITGKGVSASGNDTHATLANKIGQIQTLTSLVMIDFYKSTVYSSSSLQSVRLAPFLKYMIKRGEVACTQYLTSIYKGSFSVPANTLVYVKVKDTAHPLTNFHGVNGGIGIDGTLGGSGAAAPSASGYTVAETEVQVNLKNYSSAKPTLYVEYYW